MRVRCTPGCTRSTFMSTDHRTKHEEFAGRQCGMPTRLSACFAQRELLGTVGIMATRAPKGAARPKDSAARSNVGAARSKGGAARSKGGASGRSRSASTAKRSAPGTGSARRPAPRGGRSRARRRGPAGRRYQPPPTNPFVILVVWATHVIAAAWMGVAHAVGAAARAIGRNTRDLDPAHRRDGVGLTLLGLAIIMAPVSWFRLGSVVGRGLSAVVPDGLGSAAWGGPLLPGVAARRHLPQPGRDAGTPPLAT